MAPAATHVNVGVVPTAVAVLAGFGVFGALGAEPAPAPVVNDQTGPAAEPLALAAVICQKYVVLFASVPGV